MTESDDFDCGIEEESVWDRMLMGDSTPGDVAELREMAEENARLRAEVARLSTLAYAYPGPKVDASLRQEVARLRAENLKLRRMLWMAHTHGMGYGDDGELQDTTRRPFIDWKRDTIEQIHEALYQRAMDNPNVRRMVEEASNVLFNDRNQADGESARAAIDDVMKDAK
jgi:hypothetical protein